MPPLILTTQSIQASYPSKLIATRSAPYSLTASKPLQTPTAIAAIEAVYHSEGRVALI